MLQVSHCAAGVRWLKHLHTVANSIDKSTDTMTPQFPSRAPCSQACTTGGTAISGRGNCLTVDQLAGQLDGCSVSHARVSCTLPFHSEEDRAVETASSAENSSPQSHLQCSRVNPQQRDSQDVVTGDSVDACAGGAGCKPKDHADLGGVAIGQEHSVSWQASARQAATVQQWFHFLVRSYFKVRRCFI